MRLGLTFDDVLLVPRKSNVLPNQVSTKVKLTKDIILNIPLLSAAMDTVTESKLAIALALEGGIGMIHKNMSIEAQADEVRKVKRFENGFIIDPLTISPDELIEEHYKVSKSSGISRLPVVENGFLVGMITDNDYSIQKHAKLKVRDRMKPLKELITAQAGITLDKANEILVESRHGTLLIVDKQNRLVAIVTRKDIEKNETFPNACKDKDKKLRVGAAVGVFDLERVEALVKAGVDIITVDSAHGHSKNVIETIKQIKKKFSIPIIAGNIATAQAAKDLISAGADVLKVGIGPGAICTTRIVTGVGVPQITAIQDVVKAAGNVSVIADGGIKYSGDVAKAIAAGATAVMIGSMFAGCDETPGRVVFNQGRKYKSYRGMGSVGAMMQGSKDRYMQKHVTESRKLVPEGIEGVVPYRGTLSENVYQLIGGLRSAMGYSGAATIDEMRRNVEFIQITKAGLKESHPHDVTITEEAPNYSASSDNDY
ncbi:TPA: IMP dehydrogenase [Candidatus Woesearchaeota archaeon]|nr:IMP dehydrogenase [Candidatus Woesearchaeota archaeon]